MKRREFITLVGGAAAWPVAAWAAPDQIRRVGAIVIKSAETAVRIAAFEDALLLLGWTNGSNLHIDYRLPEANRESLRAAERWQAPQKARTITGQVQIQMRSLRYFDPLFHRSSDTGSSPLRSRISVSTRRVKTNSW